jgi:hypothetical protein
VVQLVEGAKLISNSNTTGLWVILKSVCYAEINRNSLGGFLSQDNW